MYFIHEKPRISANIKSTTYVVWYKCPLSLRNQYIETTRIMFYSLSNTFFCYRKFLLVSDKWWLTTEITNEVPSFCGQAKQITMAIKWDFTDFSNSFTLEKRYTDESKCMKTYPKYAENLCSFFWKLVGKEIVNYHIHNARSITCLMLFSCYSSIIYFLLYWYS